MTGRVFQRRQVKESVGVCLPVSWASLRGSGTLVEASLTVGLTFLMHAIRDASKGRQQLVRVFLRRSGYV